MLTVMLDEELKAKFDVLAAPNTEWDVFIRDAVREKLDQMERKAARYAAAQAEAQAILNGPRTPWDESTKRLCEKYGLADLSHLSPEELADQAEVIVAEMPAETRAMLERDGWL